MEIIVSRDKYLSANDFYESFKEKLSYCQARIKNLLDCPLREVNLDELNEFIQEEKQLKAIVEALREYRGRLGV